MDFNKFRKHRRALQHVDVSVRSYHAKESVPNPQFMIGHSFKYHTTISFMAPFVQSLPTKWTIILAPMHAIDASKHPRKSPRCVLCHDPSCFFFIWSSQIVRSKHNHHRPTKYVH